MIRFSLASYITKTIDHTEDNVIIQERLCRQFRYMLYDILKLLWSWLIGRNVLFIYKLNEYVFDLVDIFPKFVWMLEFEICFLFVTQFHFHYGVYQICIDVSDYNEMHL